MEKVDIEKEAQAITMVATALLSVSIMAMPNGLSGEAGSKYCEASMVSLKETIKPRLARLRDRLRAELLEEIQAANRELDAALGRKG